MSKVLITDTIIEYVANRMSVGAHKHQIKREIEKHAFQDAKISIEVYEDIRRKARELIRARATKSHQQVQEELEAALWETIESETGATRIKAIETLAGIRGVGAKFKQPESVTAESIQKLLREMDEVEETPNATDEGSGSGDCAGASVSDD